MLIDNYKKFEALADSNRLKILDLFDQVSELTPTIIAELISIKPSLCTHHLQTLKRAGFLEINKAGRMKIVTRKIDNFQDLSLELNNLVQAQQLKEKSQ